MTEKHARPLRPKVSRMRLSLTLSVAVHGLVVFAFEGVAATRPPSTRPPPEVPLQVMSALRPEAPVPVDVEPPPPPPPAAQATPVRAERPHEAPVRRAVARAPAPTPPSAPQSAAPPPLATSAQGTDAVPSAADNAPSAAPSTSPVAAAPAPTRPPEASAGAHGAPGPMVDVGEYLSALQARVSRHRRYPQMALEMGLEGEVRVRVVVNPDGTLAAPPAVEESSGHDMLDQEALRIVTRAAPFPPLTGHGAPVRLRVPVQFHIDE